LQKFSLARAGTVGNAAQLLALEEGRSLGLTTALDAVG
jgi:hypothetical protein